MSGQRRNRKPIIKFKQRITKDFKIDNSTPLHPPYQTHEDLTVIQGAGYQVNAKQMIIDKKDVNSY